MCSILFLNLLTLIVACNSARILVVVPTPSISHQVVFRPLTLELSKRGHEVVIITTDPIFAKGKAPTNYTEIDVHDISYDLWKKFVATTSSTNDLLEQVRVGTEQIQMIFEQQLKIKEVQELLNDKEQKFDLLFIESWVISTLALTHIFKVPTILFSTLGPLPGMYETVGAPTHWSLYPLPLSQRFRNLSVWEKISQHYLTYSIESVYLEIEAVGNQIMRNMFGSDFPTIRELKDNVDMIFLNIHPVWDFNRPVPPNVIYLGGLHQKPPKMLPQELKTYLDSSPNGVIYMSFGTNVKPSILPRETINIFLNVFADLPYNVLWKWDQDELKGKPDNVNISKWFPQSDLLHHSNVKLFISQGGLQSTDESITALVPLIGIPLLADQWFNTEMYEQHKIGIKLNIETVTEVKLKNAINAVLKDDGYRSNILRLRNIIKDQPQNSLDRAVWWTEYVLRHKGARHLRSPAANITWANYLELELVAIVLTGFLVLIITLVFVMKLVFRLTVPNLKIKTY